MRFATSKKNNPIGRAIGLYGSRRQCIITVLMLTTFALIVVGTLPSQMWAQKEGSAVPSTSKSAPAPGTEADDTSAVQSAKTRFDAFSGVETNIAADGTIVIVDVTDKGNSRQTGLKKGDKIVHYDGRMLKSRSDTQRLLEQNADQAYHIVRLTRQGSDEIEVVLGRHLELLGMLIVPDSGSRPLVRRVEANSPAAEGGVHAQDIVLGVSGRKTGDFKEFNEFAVPLVRKMSAGQELNLRLIRETEEIDVTVIRSEDVKLPLVAGPTKADAKKAEGQKSSAKGSSEKMAKGHAKISNRSGAVIAVLYSSAELTRIMPQTQTTPSTPGVALPGAVQPGNLQPGVVQPGTVEPGTVEPGINEPGTVQPGTVEPGNAVPADPAPPSNPNLPNPAPNNPGGQRRVLPNKGPARSSVTPEGSEGIPGQVTNAFQVAPKSSGTASPGTASPGTARSADAPNAPTQNQDNQPGSSAGDGTETGIVPNGANPIGNQTTIPGGLNTLEPGFLPLPSIAQSVTNHMGVVIVSQGGVQARLFGLPHGTYKLVVHEYGDCGNLYQNSAGSIVAVLATFQVGSDGRADIQQPTEQTVNAPDLLGRVVSIVAPDAVVVENTVTSSEAINISAYGVFGLASPARVPK